MTFIKALNKAVDMIKDSIKYERYSSTNEAKEIADMLCELTGNDWRINSVGSDGWYIWENE